MTIQNSRLIVKISECDIFSGGNIIDKIPELFFKKRNLLIMKNDDNKCFLYRYIRKFKNIVTTYHSHSPPIGTYVTCSQKPRLNHHLTPLAMPFIKYHVKTVTPHTVFKHVAHFT